MTDRQTPEEKARADAYAAGAVAERDHTLRAVVERDAARTRLADVERELIEAKRLVELWKVKHQEARDGFSKAFATTQEKHDAMRSAQDRAEVAEREHAEAQTTIAALREFLKMTADCLPLEHAQRDRAMRVYFGKTAGLGGHVRARMLREAANVADAECSSNVSGPWVDGWRDCARRIRVLADEAEHEA